MEMWNIDHIILSLWGCCCICLVLNRAILQWYHIDGLVQERHNSSALAVELCLSCTNPLIWASWSLNSPVTCLFNNFKPSTKASKVLITDPLWGESTSHQWIPCSKGQHHGKHFHCHMCSAVVSDVHLQWMSLGLIFQNDKWPIYSNSSAKLPLNFKWLS